MIENRNNNKLRRGFKGQAGTSPPLLVESIKEETRRITRGVDDGVEEEEEEEDDDDDEERGVEFVVISD